MAVADGGGLAAGRQQAQLELRQLALLLRAAAAAAAAAARSGRQRHQVIQRGPSSTTTSCRRVVHVVVGTSAGISVVVRVVVAQQPQAHQVLPLHLAGIVVPATPAAGCCPRRPAAALRGRGGEACQRTERVGCVSRLAVVVSLHVLRAVGTRSSL
jgi:hypothetical protein